jgi:hypothetical protein
MNFDGTLCETFLVGEIAVVREIDVFEGADDKADVLGEDERFACETGSFPGRVCWIQYLERVSTVSILSLEYVHHPSGLPSR